MVGRRQLSRDFEDELADHVARDVAYRMREGATPEEAERAARATLGGVAATREELRDANGLALLDGVTADARHALRIRAAERQAA
jgi:hypothetical protein